MLSEWRPLSQVKRDFIASNNHPLLSLAHLLQALTNLT